MAIIKKHNKTTKPIETSLGILKGRDCIYLDKVYKNDRSYLFEGETNGRLLNNGKDSFIKLAKPNPLLVIYVYIKKRLKKRKEDESHEV